MALTPGLAWAFPAVFVCLVLAGRLTNAAVWAEPGGVAVAVAVFVLPLLYTIPRGRVVWAGHRGLLLAAQATPVYVPLAVFSPDWSTAPPGMLAGLLLLTVAAPWSWILAGAVIALQAAHISVFGLPVANAATVTFMFVAPANVALTLFGLARLADLVAGLHAARADLAALAITQERRWAAERLRVAVGDHLATVTAHAQSALAVLQDSPVQARARLREAAGSARQALERIRTVMATDRPAADARHASRGTGGMLAPRLARLVLVAVLGAYAAGLGANVLVAGGAAAAVAGGVATIVTVAALQVHHSLAARAPARPRAWRWTLTAQALLPFAWFSYYDWGLLGLTGFVAGSVLLLVPRRWAWMAVASILAGVGLLWALPMLGVYSGVHGHQPALGTVGVADVLHEVVATAGTGMVVYGLSRLTDLADDLDAARSQLARMAVEQERLRVAQDTHDLLGLGLSGVALKCDLAGRLIGRDNAGARAELQALLRLCAQARADIQAVTATQRRLSLRAETAVARDLLASAGIHAQVHDSAPAGPLPAAVETVLATVVREAVTNVLRHASATRCDIKLTADQDAISIQVTNDGVTDQPDQAQPPESSRRAGRGLASLSTRAAALGGRLATHTEGGHYQLTVQIPLPAAASARHGSNPPAGSDPTHDADKPAGRSVPREP